MTDNRLTDERKQRLKATLLQWLDDTLDAEALPSGIAADIIDALEQDTLDKPETDTDWFSLESALTGLTQEIKLQSRAFARLNDHFENQPKPNTPSSSDEITRRLARIQSTLDQAARGDGANKPDLLYGKGVTLLLDMRDRLVSAEQAAQISLEAAEAALPNWWPARLLIKKSSTQLIDGYQSLLKGYRMTLERLDDALTTVDISETARIGDPFDPTIMKVVDIEESDQQEGTVLCVYRNGYRRKDELLRPAEVKVSRATV